MAVLSLNSSPVILSSVLLFCLIFSPLQTCPPVLSFSCTSPFRFKHHMFSTFISSPVLSCFQTLQSCFCHQHRSCPVLSCPILSCHVFFSLVLSSTPISCSFLFSPVTVIFICFELSCTQHLTCPPSHQLFSCPVTVLYVGPVTFILSPSSLAMYCICMSVKCGAGLIDRGGGGGRSLTNLAVAGELTATYS